MSPENSKVQWYQLVLYTAAPSLSAIETGGDLCFFSTQQKTLNEGVYIP